MRATQHRDRSYRLLSLTIAAAIVAVMVPAASASAATAPPHGASTPANSKKSAKTAPGQPGFGDTGMAVESVQRALIANGFTLRGGVTGVFEANTRRTLRNFQRVVGLRVTGVVDMPTAQVLRLAAPASTSSIPPAAASFPFTLETLPRRGASGTAVQTVQKTLAATGLAVRGGIDGFFGRGTTSTILEYQKIKGLVETGLLDEATAVSLGLIAPVPATTAPAPTAAPTTTAAPAPTNAPTTTAAPVVSTAATPALTFDTLPKRGDRGESVAAVQRALIAAGTEVKGGADGVFGVGTSAAITRYQGANGFVASGRLDFRTARALNLIAAPPVEIQVFPMQGPCGYSDTWHAPRGTRKHLGVDLIGAEGLLIYAVADGTITKTYIAGQNALTGNGLRLTIADGTYFFYGHLQRLADGIGVGTKVKAGQVLGTNGKTGNTNTPHLHFEVHPQGGEAINPTAIVAAVDACNVTAPRPAP
ncbi:MAG: hypothetical protein FJW53_02275 [Actinobacteria bacterium]|nr:hypothetical protein [Actinomycetota bacterium]